MVGLVVGLYSGKYVGRRAHVLCADGSDDAGDYLEAGSQ